MKPLGTILICELANLQTDQSSGSVLRQTLCCAADRAVIGTGTDESLGVQRSVCLPRGKNLQEQTKSSSTPKAICLICDRLLWVTGLTCSYESQCSRYDRVTWSLGIPCSLCVMCIIYFLFHTSLEHFSSHPKRSTLEGGTSLTTTNVKCVMSWCSWGVEGLLIEGSFIWKTTLFL